MIWLQDVLVHTDVFSFSSLGIKLFVILLGLALSALFSGAEVAFFSLGHHRDKLNGSMPAMKYVMEMIAHPRRLLATILIGNTFANIITSVMAAVITGEMAGHFGAPEWVIYTVEIIVITFSIVILSEITPKVVAIKDPVGVSQRLSFFIYTFYVLLKPFANTIASNTQRIEARFPKASTKISADDIKTIAEVGEQHGSLKEDEREIFENMAEFGSTTVKEIMTSRVDIIAVSTEDTLKEVVELIRKENVSRMPLYDGDIDTIVGIIYAKDVLPYLTTDLDTTHINWKTIARKPLFVPTTKKLDDLLRNFQQEKTHIAIVVDEYGGTEGLITLDDILSEIIGDISDETSNDEALYSQLRQDVYLFDAKIDLDDMEEVLDTELTSDDDDYETLGGLIYHITERIPKVGEKIIFRGLELTVHSLANNRLSKVRVKKLQEDRPELKK